MKNTVKHLFALACLCGGLACALPAGAQQEDNDPRSTGGGKCSQSAYNCVGAPNPLPAVKTVWIEEMTWMDVRDALAAGKTTVIIAAGGVEPNGPWLALGKHNYVARATCDAIARKLGNALCAPVVAFVPEGDIDAKSGHMNSVGTVGVQEDTYEALITDVARSMRAHGFEHIVLIGDHGGDQQGMKAVADKLNAAWHSKPAVLFIPEYYKSWDGVEAILREKGVAKAGVSDGLHDDPTTTLLMMLVDPGTVRWQERVKAGKASIDGVSLTDKKKDLQWGRELLEYRAAVTAAAITKARASEPSVGR